MVNMIEKAKALAKYTETLANGKHWGVDDQDTLEWLINKAESVDEEMINGKCNRHHIDLALGQMKKPDCPYCEIERLEKLCDVRDWEIACLVDLSDLRENKEVLVSRRKEPQLDAEEPRATIKITGPQRLIDELSDFITSE